MSISALRDALQPQRSLLRNVFLALAAVAAIVAGLLAMHSLNLESHHGEVAVVQTAAVAGHHHADSADPASNLSGVIDACPGDCGMEDSMVGGCILALVATGLALFGAALISRWSAVGVALARIASSATTIALPAPPSLLVLSISRT